MTKPCGVVGVFLDPRGESIASACDFGEAYGVFTRKEAQARRVRAALNKAVINSYAGPLLADAIVPEFAEKIVDRMVKAGARLAITGIGHDNPDDSST